VNGSVNTYPKPGVWNTYKSAPLVWDNSMFNWLILGVEREFPGDHMCGNSHPAYVYIDDVDILYLDANVSNSPMPNLVIEGEVIDTPRDEERCETITILPEAVSNGNPTVITAESKFIAGDFVVLDSPIGSFIEISPLENMVIAEISNCLFCAEAYNPNIEELCYVWPMEDPTPSFPSFSLTSPPLVSQNPNMNYTWACINDPLMNSQIVNPNTFNASVNAPQPWPNLPNIQPGGWYEFFFTLTESNTNGIVMNQWLVQYGIAECGSGGEEIVMEENERFFLYSTATSNFESNCFDISGMKKYSSNSIISNDIMSSLGVQNSIGINVYPNPFTDVATVSFSEAGNYNLVVVDLTGKVVLTTVNAGANKVNLDLGALNNGVYILKIVDANGATTTKKLMLQ
jgi:hypothetical protein